MLAIDLHKRVTYPHHVIHALVVRVPQVGDVLHEVGGLRVDLDADAKQSTLLTDLLALDALVGLPQRQATPGRAVASDRIILRNEFRPVLMWILPGLRAHVAVCHVAQLARGLLAAEVAELRVCDARSSLRLL